MLCPSKMLESHDVTVHLFNHVVNAREEMLTSLMIAGELLGESDEALVVDIERSRVKLFEPELLQYRPKVDYVLSCFDGSVGFCFCRAEVMMVCLLLRALKVPVWSPSEKQTPVWDLESL